MSCVAYRDGVLAADSRAFGGGYCPSPGVKQKVFALNDGRRVGVTSGKPGQSECFLTYIEGTVARVDLAGIEWDLHAMVVMPDGSIFLAYDSLDLSGPIETDFYAIGSGSKYAMGAMAAGASAVEAVAAAIRFDAHCGGEVRTV